MTGLPKRFGNGIDISIGCRWLPSAAEGSLQVSEEGSNGNALDERLGGEPHRLGHFVRNPRIISRTCLRRLASQVALVKS